jgi:hypothetical protein
MKPLAARSVVALLFTSTLASGCSPDLGSSSVPRLDAGSPPTTAAPAVGPAPLRRLTNGEYLNALADLFPGQKPILPTLPNDTLLGGFDNAAEVQQPSDVRIARYDAIANLYAERGTGDTAAVRTLVGCDDWGTSAAATACASRFIEVTGSRIFRHPMTQPERERFERRFATWMAAIDFEAAVRLTLSALLQAPQFLYRAEPASTPAPTLDGNPAVVVPVEPYAMASRLSFLLWESVPDDVLLAAAANDQLKTVAQIHAQAERMLHDDRARRMYWSFHRQWLGLDHITDEEHLVRTSEVDPSWTSASPTAALNESRLFIENILMETGSLRDLLTSPRAWVNGEMARIYGVTAPADPAASSAVSLPTSERAGILTRAAFLAGYSHRGSTSPPLRGNALQLRLLCQPPLPPPPGVDLSTPVAEPGSGPQTNRMLFEARTNPPACQPCHMGLNGFGFGFENYSASGAYQRLDHGLPIDASGEIHRTDVDQRYRGGVALSQDLSASKVVHQCALQQWLRYALGRAPTSLEAPMMDAMIDRFMTSGGNVASLLLDFVAQPTFRMRQLGGSP